MAAVCLVHRLIIDHKSLVLAVLSPKFCTCPSGCFVLWCLQSRAIESLFLVATPLDEFVGTKADLLAEMTFLWCCKFHVVSVTLLKVRTARLAFQKRFLVLSVRFLRRCLFQVVSLSSRFETTPDLNASKHIKIVVRKV